MARSFAEWVARITIGTTHLILFILSILSGRILSCTPCPSTLDLRIDHWTTDAYGVPQVRQDAKPRRSMALTR
jgi:hypothetical protein